MPTFGSLVGRRTCGLPILANPILANPFLANPFFCVVVVGFGCVCVWWVCSGLSAGPLRRTPLLPDPPPPDRPKFRAFSLSSRHNFHSFLPLFWSFSLNFGGVFEDRDPQMCTFGLSGCRVKPRRPHQTGPPGSHTQTRTFERPGASNTTKIPREDPQRGKKRTNLAAGEGKRAKLKAVQGKGGPGKGGPGKGGPGKGGPNQTLKPTPTRETPTP